MQNLLKKILKLIQIVREGFLLDLLQNKVAAGVEHLSILAPLDCNHVVDIGANRGQFALAARKCFPQARIDSFEPLVEPGEQFLALFTGDHHVTLHPHAVGSESGEAEIHVSNRDDSSSLLPITAQQSTLFPGTSERGSRTISVVKLEDVITENEIQSSALLKLDVQGFEKQVLLGCVAYLKKFRYIYVECSYVELYEGQAFADEIIAFLHEYDFILKGVYNPCYDDKGLAIQADFLFISREK